VWNPSDARDVNELLVSNGLARIYGTRTPLPDGQDSREYLAHLHELKNEAKAAKRGARPLYFERGMGKSSNRALAGNCGQPVALLCTERVSSSGKRGGAPLPGPRKTRVYNDISGRGSAWESRRDNYCCNKQRK